MESSIAYPTSVGHQPSSFGIDNILTGMNMAAPTTPTQLHHNHYGVSNNAIIIVALLTETTGLYCGAP